MAVELQPYHPVVPPETVSFLGQEGLHMTWYPYPSKHFWKAGESTRQAQSLDNSDEVLSLMSRKGLQGSLDAIDMTVGCRFPCQTCIRDSQALSSTMALEAFEKIVQNPSFPLLIPDWSLCVGFAAEPSDNPHIVEMMRTLLARVSDRKHGFRINLKTNFRIQKDETVRQLMYLVNKSDKAVLTISLPLNRDTHVQDEFAQFRERNAELFNENIIIFDLRNPTWQEIENQGRVLSGAEGPMMAEVEAFQHRGEAGLLLNPEGLWLMVNATKYESHTPEIFTPVTGENIDLIAAKMRWMRSGSGVDYSVAKLMLQSARARGGEFPPRIT